MEQRISGPREPWLAGLLSGVLPGLGQVYCGQVAKGFAVLGMLVGACLACMLTCGMLFMLPTAVWVIGIVDSALIAVKLRDGKSVGLWEFF
jgi:TM2 domain-containing membrane protein YozV